MHEAEAMSPSKIFEMYKKGYKYPYAGTETMDDGKYDVIELAPEDRKNPIYKVRLYINQKDKTLKSWQMFRNNGSRYTYTIKKFQANPRSQEPNDRKVCDRQSGLRRTLTVSEASGSHQASRVKRVALHGQFAYAVVAHSTFTRRSSSLTTLNMRTGRKAIAAIVLPDQAVSGEVSDVVDLIAAPRGRAVLRVRNDFAAGIVLTDAKAGVAFLDEGLARNIGRPRVRGSRVAWKHSW